MQPKSIRQKKINKGIIYQGPSLLDGAPIVVVAIADANNRKTGDMVQTYIIRSDIDPIAANRTGADAAVCGDCRHKGNANQSKDKGLADARTCYVNLGQAPLAVYKSFIAGKYPILTADQAKAMVSGRMLRIGSYGDGAAVPAAVWDNLKETAIGFTAYSHQIKHKAINPENLRHYMISADTASEAKQAHKLGYRTFRVISIADASKPLLDNEIICPSDKGITCNDCRLCNGTKSKAKSIAIIAHGPTAAKFKG